jgi:hypothetical protein
VELTLRVQQLIVLIVQKGIIALELPQKLNVRQEHTVHSKVELKLLS